MIDLFARHARRLCVGSLLSLALAGCSVTGEGLRSAGFSDLQPQAMTHYAALSAEKFPVEAIGSAQGALTTTDRDRQANGQPPAGGPG